MSIRSELETRLKTFADAQIPPIPVAWEGQPFTPPANGAFFEVKMLASTRVAHSISAENVRTRGNFQVNVVVRDGVGSKVADDLAESVIALYPMLPKTGTVSVEQPPQKSAAILSLDKRVIAVTVNYRQES
jgi:pyruvate/2-oxoglutarate/acetoin dehydrogenase E1 component